MRCCVQNCFNDDRNRTNLSQGITFHKLPEHPDDHAAWLKVLSTTGSQPTSSSVVCSQHFKAEDFDDTWPNQQRLKSGAVPIVFPDSQAELKVCRVCLALDVKMYDMKDFKLGEMFQNITGIMACDEKESILQHVCWECAARLKAAATFRDKALLSDALLQDLVNITKRDIASIKDNHGTLKSSLITQNAFHTADIECKHTPSKNKETDLLYNVEIDLKERNTGIKLNDERKEIEVDAYEPLIDVPIKTEIEFDPIPDNDINITVKDGKRDFMEIGNFDNDSMPPREVNEDLVENKGPSHKSDKISSEQVDKTSKPAIKDESNAVLCESEVGKIKVDTSIENSGEQKMKDKTGPKIRTTNKKVRLDESTIEKIIALKKRGLSVPEIAKETGLSRQTIYLWWHRWCKNGKVKHRESTSVEQDHSMVDRIRKQQCSSSKLTEEISVSANAVRLRLHEASMKPISVHNPDINVKLGRRINKHKGLHDDMKQQIIELKQQGLSVSRTACLLGTTRNTVSKWWQRWCKEGHVRNYKISGGKRKTTAQEDQFLIDKVTQEQSVHTPSLAKELGISARTVRNRLWDAGFRSKERKASVPLRSGRRHKVDDETKQQIIMLKQSGVSVTDIANQFRVTRTSVYLWWRRWCKQNNIRITTDDNLTNTMAEQDNPTKHGEKSIHTPSIISSQKTLWQKLPDVEFISQPRSDEKVKIIEEKKQYEE